MKEYHNHEEEDSPSISNDMVGMLKSSPNRLLVVVLKRATEFDCRRCISARIISCQSGDLRCTLTGWSEVIWPSYSSACSAIWPLLNVTSISPSTNLHETRTFNKIAVQAKAQMAADKEARVLSRVYMYESKCILPLRDDCLYCVPKHINATRMQTNQLTIYFNN